MAPWLRSAVTATGSPAESWDDRERQTEPRDDASSAKVVLEAGDVHGERAGDDGDDLGP